MIKSKSHWVLDFFDHFAITNKKATETGDFENSQSKS